MINKILDKKINNNKKNKHIPTIQHEVHALIPLVGIFALNLYNRLTQYHSCRIVKNKLHI